MTRINQTKKFLNASAVSITIITLLVVVLLLINSQDMPSENQVGKAASTEYVGYAVQETFSMSDNNYVFSHENDYKIIELDIDDDAIYHQGYISNNEEDWVLFDLSPVGLRSGNWIRDSATASIRLDASQLSNPNTADNYIVIYTCSDVNNSWDCHDGWQIVQFDTSINVPIIPGETRFIVENSLPLSDIVISPNAPNTVNLAAEYFQYFINEMSGVNLSINNNPDPIYDFHVYIGQSNYTDALGITADGCVHDGYKMSSGENYLVLLGDDEEFVITGPTTQEEWDALTGGRWSNDYISYYGREYGSSYDFWETDGRGSLNAVYQFLYEQGMRWYHPGWYEYEDFGTITPSKTDIGFNDVNKLVNPDFAMRDFYMYDKGIGYGSYHYDGRVEEEHQWFLSLGGNSYYEFIIGSLGGPGHGLHAVSSRQADAHPEFYAIANGVSTLESSYPNHNLCYPYDTDENILFREAVEYAKTMFDNYDVKIVSLMPSDGFGSIDDACTELATPERGGNGRYSDYVWEFVNNAAWEIYNDPNYGVDKKIHCAAYTSYLLPPESLSQPVAPNLVVNLAKWRSNNANLDTEQYYNDLTNEWVEFLASNNDLTGGVETNEIFTYDYYLHNAPYRGMRSVPIYFPHIISDDLKFLKGKVNGEFIEISTLSSWPPYDPRVGDGEWLLEWDSFISQSLNTYITARLYWDADQDVDALLDEYYNLFYGPAAQEIKTLVEYSEDNYDTELYNPVFMATIRGMAEDALAAAGGDTNIYGHRVTLLIELINLDYDGDEAFIDSCQILGSGGSTYKLTQDVSAQGTCFTFDASGVTLDCQGHTITYSTAGGSDDNAIHNDAFNTYRGDYFAIKNCVIQDGSYNTGQTTGPAIYLGYTDEGVVENTIINTSGVGISNIVTYNNNYTGNTIYSVGTGFYVDRGSGHKLINNNIISEYVSTGFYEHGDATIINNTLFSETRQGLKIATSNNLITNNNATSRLSYGMDIGGDNNTVIGNTGVSKEHTIGLRVSGIGNTITENIGIVESNLDNYAFGLEIRGSDHICNDNTGISYSDYMYSSGVAIVTSNSTFTNTKAIGNIKGLSLYSAANNIFYNCEELSGGVHDVYFHWYQNSINNSIINCSYDTEQMSSPGGYLFRKWYLDYHVTDGGQDLEGATITSVDSLGNTQVTTTESQGRARLILTEYMNNGTTISHTPHTVTVEYNGYEIDERVHSMTTNVQVEVTLSTSVLPTETCDDGILNQDETFTDCGGSCPACECTTSQTQSCSIANGVGEQTRSCNDGTYSSWGTCTVVSCNSGYRVSGNSCVEDVPPQTGDAIIADHNSADDFDIIPQCWIEQAKQDFKIGYGHTSHGSQITAGIWGLSQILNSQGNYPQNFFLTSANSVPDYLTLVDGGGGHLSGDLGYGTWPTYTRNYLNDPTYSDSTAVMWSWCGQVNDVDLQTHLFDNLDSLKSDYPDVTFIYMTGHLEADQAVLAANNQIRAYAIANGDVLYDFADIEKWDPNGVEYPLNTDACQWCSTWCSTEEDCTQILEEVTYCSHSHDYNCYRKAKAFWWMMARMAGWDGTAGHTCS